MEKFEKLTKVLDADSEDGIVDLAVEKITELNDSVTAKDAEIATLKKQLADEGEEAPAEDGKPKEGEDPAEDKPKEGEGKEGTEEGEDANLKAENEKLKKENEELKEEAGKKADSLKELQDSVEKLSKRTDAIGKKQVKPLYHDSDDKIEELKTARLNIYADARKAK